MRVLYEPQRPFWHVVAREALGVAARLLVVFFIAGLLLLPFASLVFDVGPLSR